MVTLAGPARSWRRTYTRTALAALAAVVLAVAAGAPDAAQAASTCLGGTTTRVNVVGTTQANNSSFAAAVSRDARYVTFISPATNLVANDTNGRRDVFLVDRLSGTIGRVSVATGGTQATGGDSGILAAGSLLPVTAPVSADGRYVAFTSAATNLVPNDTNAWVDVFVRDRQIGTTELISATPSGATGNGDSSRPAMSGDGRFVAFSSTATDLGGADTNLARADVFVRDRQTGTTILASMGPDGAQLPGGAGRPAISDDGRYVAFIGSIDAKVYVRDLQSGVTEIVSVSSTGQPANALAQDLAMTPDGRFVAFSSTATNLVPGDANGSMDIFVRDRVAGTTERASLTLAGAEANDGSFAPAISPDGRFVAFQSLATNLVPNDTNGVTDVFIRDRTGATTVRASVSSAGAQTGSHSSEPALSATSPAGSAGPLVFVAFESAARQLVPDKTTTSSDIFVRELSEAAAAPLTLTATATPQPNAAGWNGSAVMVSLAASGGCGQPIIRYALTGAQTATGTATSTKSVTITAEGTTTLSYSASDAVGSTATQSLDIRIDKTPPLVSYTLDPPGGSSTDPVTVTFTASDPLSGLAGVPVDANGIATVSVTVDPRVTSTVSQTFSDRAGNTTTATAGILPLTVDASASPAPTAAGWNNTDVVVKITASGGSVGTHRITYQLTGAENRGATVTACSFRSCEVDSITLTIKTEGTTTLSYSATDAAGNSTATRSLGIKIDKTPPDVSYVLDPPGGSSTDPVTVTFTASDALSGLAGVPVDASGVATVRVTVDPRVQSSVSRTFTDRAGNAPVVTADVLPARGCVVGTTRRASVTSSGAQVHGASSAPAISGDGRFVAFASAASNLVPGDTNGVTDIFVHDRLTGAIERMSVSSAGAQANGGSSRPALSQHGVLVVFESDATNLVLGDTNGKRDIFVHNRLTHSTTRVSVNSDGTQIHAFGPTSWESFGGPTIDGSGRFVAFTGSPISGFDFPHVLLHDRVTHTTTIAGLAENGGAVRSQSGAALSGDGRYLAYVAGCCSATFDLLIRDLVGGTVTRASHNVFGSDLADPVLSGDGRYAAFTAKLGGTQVWVHDRVSGTTQLVAPVGFPVGHPSISADGRYIAFFSLATNLVKDDTNGKADVFVYDQTTGAIERASLSSQGLQADGGSHDPAISADGQIVAFDSDATNIGSGDTNATSDIYVRERQGQASSCTAAPLSVVASASPAANPAGWNNADVTVTIAATGGTGGLQIGYTLSGAQTDSRLVSGSSAAVTIRTEGTTSLTYHAQDASGAKSPDQTLVVRLDKTPPTVTTARTPAANSYGWNNSDVTVSFQASDGLSGIADAASADVVLGLEGAGQSASRTFADKAGNTATATVSDVNIDKTPPQVTFGMPSPAPNAAGWNNTDVTIPFTATDALSGVASVSPPGGALTLSTEGVGVTGQVTAMDRAGNSAIASSPARNIDKTAPVTTASATPGPNAAGWNNTDVTVSLSATDNLSGVASTTLTLDGAPVAATSVTVKAEGTHTIAYASTDNAGNVEATKTLTIRIDKTPPEAVNAFDPKTLDLAVSGRDAISGVASVTLTTAPAPKKGPIGGEKAVRRTYVITDVAGNATTLVEDVRTAGHELRGTVVSIRYGGGPEIAFPENELKLEWALAKDGSLKELEQRLEVGKGRDRHGVEAKFEAKKNETRIKVEQPKRETKLVQPGLVLLRLATQSGQLVIEY